MNRTQRSWKRIGTGLLLAAAAVLVLYAGWFLVGLVAFATDDDGPSRYETVSCKEAMRFADQKGLPPGAHAAKCGVTSALDTMYEARFRIPRADLDAWLASAFPDAKLTTHCPAATADACTGTVTLDPYADGGAQGIDVTVRNEAGHDPMVRFQAFNT